MATHREIIDQFARKIGPKYTGVRPLTKLLGYDHHSTVHWWYYKNCIPRHRWREVIDAGKKHRMGLKLSDFEG
jgi:hypothetical protein